jgi:hypothetical protein
MNPPNPDQVRYVTSGVERFLQDVDGETYGLLLANGMEVRFEPRLAARVVASVRAGDRITVYGVHPRTSATSSQVTRTIIASVAVVTSGGEPLLEDAPRLASSASAEDGPRRHAPALQAIPYALWRADGHEPGQSPLGWI